MGTDSSTNYQISPNDRLVVPHDANYPASFPPPSLRRYQIGIRSTMFRVTFFFRRS